MQFQSFSDNELKEFLKRTFKVKDISNEKLLNN